MRIVHVLSRILRDHRGATAIEYGLIVALIVIAILATLKGVADENTGIWTYVMSNVDANM